MYYPLVIAHRGASSYALENTMEAFELAIELGSDFIEFDVRKTIDDVLVIHHDPEIKTSGQTIMLNDINYAQLLALAPYPVPTLENVLIAFKKRVKFDIELKEGGYEVFFLDFVLEQLKRNEFIITSFYDETISTIKKQSPKIKAGLILGMDKPRNLVATRYTELFPWNRLKKCGADFAAPHYKLLNPLFMQTAARKHFPIFAWTVDEPEVIKKLIRQKVQGIITNKPDLAVTIRDDIINESLPF